MPERTAIQGAFTKPGKLLQLYMENRKSDTRENDTHFKSLRRIYEYLLYNVTETIIGFPM